MEKTWEIDGSRQEENPARGNRTRPAMLLILSGGVFFLLGQTGLPAEELSPEQNLKFMEKLRQNSEGPLNRALPKPKAGSKASQRETVRIRGTVHTEDGGPIPKDLYLRYHVQYALGSSSGGSVEIRPTGSIGTFEEEVPLGRFTGGLWLEGYAPCQVGPMDLKADPNLSLTITLSRGFTGEIRVLDEEQNPVSQAILSGRFDLVPGFSSSSSQRQWESNEEGRIEIAHAAENVPLAGKIQAEGYELADVKLWFRKDTPSTVVLKRSASLTGTVVDALTGKPISDAELQVVFANTLHRNQPWVDPNPLSCRTDAEGRFVFNELPRGYIYDIQAKAPGYGYQFQADLAPGQSGVVFPMHPQQRIRCTYFGPSERLHQRDGTSYIHYSCSYQSGGMCSGGMSSREFGGSLPVRFIDSVGSFEMEEIWGNCFGFSLKDLHLSVPFDPNDVKPVVLDLSEADVSGLAANRVELTFDTQGQEPLPLGKITLITIEDRPDELYVKSHTREIVNGTLRTQLPAPSLLLCQSDRTEGYKFSTRDGQFTVPASPQPAAFRIDAQPVGMVYGTLKGLDHLADSRSIQMEVCNSNNQMTSQHPSIDHLKGQASDRSGTVDYTARDIQLGTGHYLFVRSGTCMVTGPLFDLTPQSPVRRVDLEFPRGTDVKIHFTDEQDRPIAGCFFEFTYENNNSGITFSFGTDSSGDCIIPNVNTDLPGRYLLSVRPERDYQPLTQVIPDPNQPVKVVLHPGAILTGRLLDSRTGKPIPDQQISARSRPESGPLGYLKSETPTDKDGAFRFSNLVPGTTYQLAAFYPPAGPPAEITAGRTQSIDLFVDAP